MNRRGVTHWPWFCQPCGETTCVSSVEEGSGRMHCGLCSSPRAEGLRPKTLTKVTADKQPDPVNPSHYVKRGIEVRHVIRAFECTYNVGTAVAYLLRAPFKGRYLEDIRKAIQHLTFELEDKGGGDGVGNGGTRDP